MNQTHGDERFWDALAAWEAAFQQGEDVPAEELCADGPDLLDKLKDHIRALKRTAWMTKRTEDEPDAAGEDDAPFQPSNLGEYTLFERIGSGGMGQVFLALHRRMERIVVVKMLPRVVVSSPEASRRFHDEVRVAAKLSHTNIVTAYDAGESDGIPFLVMERIGGMDLQRYVRKHGPLPIEQAVSVIAQAAHGLKYAHDQSIIHCDVKPANLLLGNDGTVKILDLGLARFYHSNSSQRAAMGTVLFMAPEQGAPNQTDHRADIYGLGCTLYFLLTGEPPFMGQTVIQSVVAHRDEPAPSLKTASPEVPAALDTVYQKMVAKQPQDRYQTMAEVIAAVEACGVWMPGDRAKTDSTGQRLRERRVRKRLLALLLFVGITTVLGGTGVFIATKLLEDHHSGQIAGADESKGSQSTVQREETKSQPKTETQRIPTVQETKPQSKTEATEKPKPDTNWIALADSLDDFKQHWKTDDKRSTIYYDKEKKQIEINSVWNIGRLLHDKPWTELEFEVVVNEPGGFQLELNGITLDFGRAFAKPPKPQLVRVKYDPDSSLVTGMVDGDVVSKATVLDANWNGKFRCLICKPGGSQCVLSISKIRLLTK